MYQSLFAIGLPMRVVDGLEAVKVDEDDRHLRAVAIAELDLALQHLVEEVAVSLRIRLLRAVPIHDRA